MQNVLERQDEISQSINNALQELSVLRDNLIRKEEILLAMEEAVEMKAPQVPRFIQPLQHVEIAEGQRFTFECRLECEGVPRLEWFKDDMPLKSPDYHTGYRDGLCTLTIDEVFSEDTARYMCRATTNTGSDQTVGSLRVKGTENNFVLSDFMKCYYLFGTIQICVVCCAEVHKKSAAPEFTKHLKSADIPEGAQMTLECQVVGTPAPRVSWQKDGIDLEKNSDFVITQINGACTLKIRRTVRDHSGQYVCKAINEAGEANSSCRINIIGRRTCG